MFGRLLIGLFYAAFFFGLGAWSGGRLEPVGIAIKEGAVVAKDNVVHIWKWATAKDFESVPKKETIVVSKVPLNVSLSDAREAFVEGDILAAIVDYNQFISLHPDSAAAWGELGNVYFNSGRTAEAAQAYYEAALLLLSEGRARSARALEPAIRAQSTVLADELAARLARLETSD
ncbi:MAG: tetratricopeptide repeat protein [Marinibacterium sp.]